MHRTPLGARIRDGFRRRRSSLRRISRWKVRRATQRTNASSPSSSSPGNSTRRGRNNELTYLSEERREFSLATEPERDGLVGLGLREETEVKSTSSVRKLSSRALLITASGWWGRRGGAEGKRHAHLHFPEGPFRSYSSESSGSGSAVI